MRVYVYHHRWVLTPAAPWGGDGNAPARVHGGWHGGQAAGGEPSRAGRSRGIGLVGS